MSTFSIENPPIGRFDGELKWRTINSVVVHQNYNDSSSNRLDAKNCEESMRD